MKNLSKFVVIFEDGGKKANKERDADHLNSLSPRHTLHAKDTEIFIKTIPPAFTFTTPRKRHRDTHWKDIDAFQQPVWKNSEDQFLNPGICLGQHIIVRTSLHFVFIILYCTFCRIKRGNTA